MGVPRGDTGLSIGGTDAVGRAVGGGGTGSDGHALGAGRNKCIEPTPVGPRESWDPAWVPHISRMTPGLLSIRQIIFLFALGASQLDGIHSRTKPIQLRHALLGRGAS